MALVIFMIILGFVYYHWRAAERETVARALPVGAHATIEAVVKGTVRRTDEYTAFSAEALAPERGVVSVRISPFLRVEYGDRLTLLGTILPPRNDHEDPFMPYPRIVAVKSGGFSLIRSLRAFAARFAANIGHTLPRREAALLTGMTSGDRSGFDKDFSAEMNASGTTHIVALSGYNISILVLAVAAACKRLRRRAAFLITIAAIVLFTTAVGGEASVVRAAIMGGLILLAKDTGRMPDLGNAIGISAALMALYDPRVVRWDIGFQLSFLSLLGVVYVSPALARYLGWNDGANNFMSWREHLATTISAQAAVLPLVVTQFGSASLTSLPANMLILPFVPVAMMAGFAIGAAGFVSASLSTLLGLIAYPLAWYLAGVIHIFSVLRVPIGNPFAHWIFVAAYYALLILFVRAHPHEKD